MIQPHTHAQSAPAAPAPVAPDAAARPIDGPAVAALSIAAFLLTGLIALLASGLFDRDALAQQAIKDSSYSALTSSVVDRDALFIIDDSKEVLLAYDVSPNNQIRLLKVEELKPLFTAARAQFRPARP